MKHNKCPKCGVINPDNWCGACAITLRRKRLKKITKLIKLVKEA
jgi:hypothetical protein